MLPYEATVLGLATFSFDHEMLVPINFTNLNFSEILSLSVVSGVDNSNIEGHFIGVHDRILVDLETLPDPYVGCKSEYSCLAEKKEFTWQLKEFNSTFFEVQLNFTDPKQISI